jgi:CRISPR system Cascade subunit CasE
MSLWLVRVALERRNRAVQKDLNDVVDLHRRVMSLLPDGLGQEARRAGGALFRLDQGRTGPVLLAQYGLEPLIDRLPRGYGEVAVREITPLVEALRPGMVVRYRIAGNASKRSWKGSNAGKIVAIDGPHAAEWWQRKAVNHGLRVIDVQSTPEPSMIGIEKEVRHAVTRFDGTAVIVDAEKVRTAVRSGIGRGKSHGCGLLSLAPMR